MKEIDVPVTKEEREIIEEIGRRSGKTASEVVSDLIIQRLDLEAARENARRPYVSPPPSSWLTESWPKILTLLMMIVVWFSKNGRVKLVALAAAVAAILTDLFMSDEAVKDRRLGRELKAMRKLRKDMPRLWDAAWREKGPEAAAAELLEMIDAQCARVHKAARDMGLE